MSILSYGERVNTVAFNLPRSESDSIADLAFTIHNSNIARRAKRGIEERKNQTPGINRLFICCT